MAIERQYIFANRRAYTIAGTIAYIDNLYREDDRINDWHYSSVCGLLGSFKYYLDDSQDWMPDLYTGMFLPTEVWLIKYGIEETTRYQMPVEDATVATFDLTDSSLDMNEDEECIESDEEDEIVVGHIVISALVREDMIERGFENAIGQLDREDFSINDVEHDYPDDWTSNLYQ